MPEHTVPAPAEPIATRWQFELRHLFGLMTLCAVAAAAAAAFGLGTLLLTGGVIVAWLNWQGAFYIVRQGRRQAVILLAAWGVFLTSLFLPSYTIFSKVHAGWEAAWFCQVVVLEAIWNLKPEILLVPWLLAIDAANLLAALLPLLIWRLARGRGQIASGILCVAMVGPWLMGGDGGWAVGYYVWVANFYIALVALPLRTPAFLTMAAAVLLALSVRFAGAFQ
jgi:hypothetical protein